MKEFKLHLREELLDKIKEAAEDAGISINQIMISALEESFQGGQVSFDYPVAMEKLVKEAQSRPAGQEFVLADLPSFTQVSVVTAEKGHMKPSAVRARLGRIFNRAVSQGRVSGVARATVMRNGEERLKFLARAAVYIKKAD